MKNIKLGVKLLGGFIFVALITLIVGGVGWYGVTTLSGHLYEVSNVRLPSVQSLFIISEAQTAVDAGENALLAKNLDEAGRQAQYTRFNEAKSRADAAWAIYAPLPQTLEEEALWKRFVPAWDAWWKDHERYVDLAREFEREPTDENYDKMSHFALVTIGESFSVAEGLLNEIVELNVRVAEAANIAAERDENFVTKAVISGMILGFIIAVLAGLLLSKSITRPIIKGVGFAQAMATGDFTQKLDIDQRDEVGTLAAALNDMVDRLRDVVAEVQTATDTVASGSEELSSPPQGLFRGQRSRLPVSRRYPPPWSR